MDLEVHWAGRHPARIGRLHQNAGGTVTFDLMDLARNLIKNQASVVELYRRAVFNVIAAKEDDHGRNHAFLMDENGRWSLPPAFDVTQASYPLATGFRAARIQGRAAGIIRRELLALGQSQGIDQPAAIIAQVIAAVTSWPTHAAVAAKHRVTI